MDAHSLPRHSPAMRAYLLVSLLGSLFMLVINLDYFFMPVPPPEGSDLHWTTPLNLVFESLWIPAVAGLYYRKRWAVALILLALSVRVGATAHTGGGHLVALGTGVVWVALFFLLNRTQWRHYR